MFQPASVQWAAPTGQLPRAAAVPRGADTGYRMIDKVLLDRVLNCVAINVTQRGNVRVCPDRMAPAPRTVIQCVS